MLKVLLSRHHILWNLEVVNQPIRGLEVVDIKMYDHYTLIVNYQISFNVHISSERYALYSRF